MRCYLSFCLCFCALWSSFVGFAQPRELFNLSSGGEQVFKSQIKDAVQLRRQQPDSSRRQLIYLLQKSILEQNQDVTIEALTALSYFTEDPRLLDQTLQFIKRGIKLSDRQRHRGNLITLYDNMGKVYFWQSRYKESFQAHLAAVQYVHNDTLTIARLENNMTIVLRAIGNIDLANQYLERSLKVGARYKDYELWANALLNIACLKEDKHTDHFFYLDSGLQVAKMGKRYDILYRGLVNKSAILVENGANEKAMQVLLWADTLLQHALIPATFQLKAAEIAGAIHTSLGQFRQAEQALMKSLSRTSAQNWLSNINLLSELYATQGNYKMAYSTLRKYQERNYNLNKRNLDISELEYQYRTAEKDKQLAKNKLALVEKETAIKSRNAWIGIMIAGALILVAIILLLRKNYRQQQKIQLSEQNNLQLKARIEGEELERNRLSLELHDGIGGILSIAKLNLSSMHPPGDAENYIKYQASVQLLDDAYTELRRTAHNMSPAILKSRGLVETVALLCQKTEEAYKIPIKFQHFGRPQLVNDEIALSVYRMIQELIQNIVKHSEASSATVQVSIQDKEVKIIVEDRGKGMVQPYKADGIGLSNIKNRVYALGGDIEIDSRVNEGTAIYITIEQNEQG